MADQSQPLHDRRGLTVLSATECLDRIRAEPVGRVAFALGDEVVVLPVNHVVVDEQIAFQTTWGSKLQVAADRGPMAFEVDGHDATSSSGWSVLVQGHATIVHDREDPDRLNAQRLTSWAPAAENMFWVVVTPRSIAGREIEPGVPPPPRTRDLRP